MRLRLALAAGLGAVLLAGCTVGAVENTQGPAAPHSVAATTVASQTAPATTTAAATRTAPASQAPTKAATVAPPKTARPAVKKLPRRPSARVRNPRLYPDPHLTPGITFRVTAAQVSVAGYASRVRNVPTAEKRDVYSEYHLSYPQKSGSYECDHFIPLCLGGSNAIKNLWPEPAPEFHWKDGLEVYLWHQVRAHKIGLAEAQRQMRTDWYSYWVADGKPGGNEAVTLLPPPATTTRRASRPSGLIVGWSTEGKRYHYLSCRYFRQIESDNRRTGTIAQARAAGKTPCLVCRPPD